MEKSRFFTHTVDVHDYKFPKRHQNLTKTSPLPHDFRAHRLYITLYTPGEDFRPGKQTRLSLEAVASDAPRACTVLQQRDADATRERAVSPLLAQHAFVVQLRADTRVKTGQIMGRVEHVVSRQATRFESLEALLAFMARVLQEVRTSPPGQTQVDLRN